MQELLKKSIEKGVRLSDHQIYDEVLGSRPGYVKGLGFGPKPAASTSTTSTVIQQLQEKLQQSQKENSQLKELLDDEIKKGEKREAMLVKHVAPSTYYIQLSIHYINHVACEIFF